MSSVTVIVALTLIAFSCTRKSDEAKHLENSGLLTELDHFNNELSASIDDPSTRGFWSTVGRICAIVGADAIGAVEGGRIGGKIGAGIGAIAGGNVVGGAVIGGAIGGVICGAGASYAADVGTRTLSTLEPGLLYNGLQTISDEDLLSVKQSAAVEVDMLPNYPNVEKIALQHNILLERVINGEVFEDVDLSQDPYAEAFKSIEFNNSYQTAVNEAVLFTRTLQNSTSKPVVDIEGLSPIANEVLSLFFDIYTEYPNKMDDIDFIVSYYMRAIEASPELTPDEKEMIFTGLAVAAYSPRLWIDKIQ